MLGVKYTANNQTKDCHSSFTIDTQYGSYILVSKFSWSGFCDHGESLNNDQQKTNDRNLTTCHAILMAALFWSSEVFTRISLHNNMRFEGASFVNRQSISENMEFEGANFVVLEPRLILENPAQRENAE